MCEWNDCVSPVLARGMCARHYQQWRRKIGSGETCSECTSPAYSKGLCFAHWKRQRRKARRAAGNPEPRHISKFTCSEPGCGKPVDARGLCAAHYAASRYANGTRPKCIIDGCSKAGAGNATGYCPMHQRRFEYTGDPLGLRRPSQATHCAECGTERVLARDRKGRHDLCRRCFRRMKWFANVTESRAKMNASQKRVRRQTPPWASRDAILRVYRERPVGMDVDHIVPLRGKLVSGLHVEYNLQYLPMSANRAKGASYAAL